MDLRISTASGRRCPRWGEEKGHTSRRWKWFLMPDSTLPPVLACPRRGHGQLERLWLSPMPTVRVEFDIKFSGWARGNSGVLFHTGGICVGLTKHWHRTRGF